MVANPAMLAFTQALTKMSDPRVAKSLADGFGSLNKAVEGDKLKDAGSALAEFANSFQVGGPAMATLTAQFNSQTMEIRTKLMSNLLDLAQTPGVQTTISLLAAIFNAVIGGAANLSTFATNILGLGSTADTASGKLSALTTPMGLLKATAVDAKTPIENLNGAIKNLGTESGEAVGKLGTSIGALLKALGINDSLAIGIEFLANKINVIAGAIETAGEIIDRVIEKFVKAGLIPTVNNPATSLPNNFDNIGGGNLIVNP